MLPGKYRQRLLISLYEQRNRALPHLGFYESFICISFLKGHTIIPSVYIKKEYRYQGNRPFYVIKAKIMSVQLRNTQIYNQY